MFNSSIFKILFVVITITILAGTAYAFAAANTVPATRAGDGNGTISGYTVSNIVYNLNATDPSTMDSVDFELSAAAATAQIKLVAAGSTWYDCTNTSANLWNCVTTGVAVSSVDQLRVLATSN